MIAATVASFALALAQPKTERIIVCPTFPWLCAPIIEPPYPPPKPTKPPVRPDRPRPSFLGSWK